jgi:sugar/nucleoside kinase (ribokinase family)
MADGPLAPPVGAAAAGGSPPPAFLVIGHVTRDVVAAAPGGFVYGGSVIFAALAAERLGHRAAILTRCAAEPGLPALLGPVALERVPADVTTTFENVYTPAGRVQYLRQMAPPIPAGAVPAAWRGAGVVHLGPVAQEVPAALVEVFPAAALVGATPQGWLRARERDGRVRTGVAWPEAERVLSRVDVLIFSPEDVAGDQALIRRYAEMSRLAVVTDGWRGCTVWRGGRRERFPAFRVDEVDPTGAGDVFATAFFLRYAASRDVADAARYANAAASFSVEALGTGALPGPEDVEQRLRSGRLLD